MKQLLKTLSIVALAATSATAQNTKNSKAYVRVGIGYSFPHSGNTYIKSTSVSFMSATEETGKYSLGAGASASLAGGYWFSKHVGAELGVNVGVAPKKFTSTYSDPSTSYTDGSVYAKMPVYVIPSLILQTAGDRLNAYTRLGLTINVAGKVIQESKSNTSELTIEHTFKTGVGFQGALGVTIPAGKKLQIFIEGNGIAMSQYLKKGKLTKAIENGKDVLPLIPVADKEMEYENSVTYVQNPDPNKPSQSPTQSVPFSNVGLTAGIIFRF